MARTSRKNLIGNVLEKVGRALSGGSSTSRRTGGGTRTTTRRRGKSTGGKGLLKKLLG